MSVRSLHGGGQSWRSGTYSLISPRGDGPSGPTGATAGEPSRLMAARARPAERRMLIRILDSLRRDSKCPRTVYGPREWPRDMIYTGIRPRMCDTYRTLCQPRKAARCGRRIPRLSPSCRGGGIDLWARFRFIQRRSTAGLYCLHVWPTVSLSNEKSAGFISLRVMAVL